MSEALSTGRQVFAALGGCAAQAEANPSRIKLHILALIDAMNALLVDHHLSNTARHFPAGSTRIDATGVRILKLRSARPDA